MIYDLAKLRSQGIPAESLAEWLDVATDADLCSSYRKMIAFYQKWGFDVFWAYKDQQRLQYFKTTFSDREKQLYIQNMLNNPPEGCSLQ